MTSPFLFLLFSLSYSLSLFLLPEPSSFLSACATAVVLEPISGVVKTLKQRHTNRVRQVTSRETGHEQRDRSQAERQVTSRQTGHEQRDRTDTEAEHRQTHTHTHRERERETERQRERECCWMNNRSCSYYVRSIPLTWKCVIVRDKSSPEGLLRGSLGPC